MRISIFLRCTLFTLLICCFSTAAQDYTQFSLPEGAIARLGKGELGQIHFLSRRQSTRGFQFYWHLVPRPADRRSIRPVGGIQKVLPLSRSHTPLMERQSLLGSTSEIIVITGRNEVRLSSSAGNTVQLRDVTTGEKKNHPQTTDTESRCPSFIHPMERQLLLQGIGTTRYICGTL